MSDHVIDILCYAVKTIGLEAKFSQPPVNIDRGTILGWTIPSKAETSKQTSFCFIQSEAKVCNTCPTQTRSLINHNISNPTRTGRQERFNNSILLTLSNKISPNCVT